MYFPGTINMHNGKARNAPPFCESDVISMIYDSDESTLEWFHNGKTAGRYALQPEPGNSHYRASMSE